jgi:hypothetical protein
VPVSRAPNDVLGAARRSRHASRAELAGPDAEFAAGVAQRALVGVGGVISAASHQRRHISGVISVASSRWRHVGGVIDGLNSMMRSNAWLSKVLRRERRRRV